MSDCGSGCRRVATGWWVGAVPRDAFRIYLWGKRKDSLKLCFLCLFNGSYFSSVLTLIWLFHHPLSIPLPIFCIFSAAVVVSKVCVSIIMRIQNGPVLFCTLPLFFPPPFCCFYFINFSFLFFPSASPALVAVFHF